MTLGLPLASLQRKRLRRHRPEWLHKSALWGFQAERNEFWGAGKKGPAELLSVTRSSGIILPNAAGVFQTLGNNTLPRTDRGLYANGQVAALNENGNNPQSGPGWANGVSASITNGTPDGFFSPVIVSGVNVNSNRRTIGLSISSPVGIKVFFDTNECATPATSPRVVVARFDVSAASIMTGSPGSLAPIQTDAGTFTIVSQTATSIFYIFTPAASGSYGFGFGPGSTSQQVRLRGIDVTSAPFVPDAWVSISSPAPTLLASDIRVVQGVRPSNAQPEPFPGWEDVGLDSGFVMDARVVLDRLNAAAQRTIAVVGLDGNQKGRLYFDTDDRMKFQLVKLGAELRGSGEVVTIGSPSPLATYDTATGAGTFNRVVGSTNNSGVRIPAAAGAAKTYLLDITGASGLGVRSGGLIGSLLFSAPAGRSTYIATLASGDGFYLAGNSDGAQGSFTVHSVREVVTHFTLQSDVIGSTGTYDVSLTAKPGAYALAVVGAGGSTNASSEALPSGMATLRIGSDFSNVNPFNGWIEELQILRAA